MKIKKINLGKLNVRQLSGRELNSVFGGQTPTTTSTTPPIISQSGNAVTVCFSGADLDAVGDYDSDVIDEHISF